MEKYNYMEAMTADVLEYIRTTYTTEEIREKLSGRDDWQEGLVDELWDFDSVTGNASGSYTMNRWKAEEYIAHHLDLLAEALDAFGCDAFCIKRGAEWCDVTIRCHLLWCAVYEAIEAIGKEV